MASHEPPTTQEAVRAVLRGISPPPHHRQRHAGQGAGHRGRPNTSMLVLCPDTLIGKRDRALLALGFAGAFRRSELCALDVADLVETPDCAC